MAWAVRFLLVIALAFSIILVSSLYIGAVGEVRVRVATATTLYDTGLLELLSESFTGSYGYPVDFFPVGTGEALRRAEMGDVCIVITHDPSRESLYIEKGVIERHGIIAVNNFIIAGPREDPARVAYSSSVVEAFKGIYEAGEKGEAVFVSRGDESGTHSRERLLWRLSSLSPYESPWYVEAGSSMAHTLLLANEKRAYVLSDIGTFLFLKSKGRLPSLEVLYYNESDPLTLNIYSVYLVASCKGDERRAALSFLQFLLGEGQDLIDDYRVKGVELRLFTPAKYYEALNGSLEEAWSRLSALGGDKR